jgi:serine protease SohB
LGDLRSTLRDRYGEEVFFPLVAVERGFFSRRVPGLGSQMAEGMSLGSGLAEELVSALEARALWSRFGL